MSKTTLRERPKDLPDFERPPVSEVVLSIQFASLTRFKSVHIGLFWDKFRSKYPKVTEQGTINPSFETFGTPTAQVGVQLQALMTPPMARYWFEKEGEPDLLQVQQDRILHNWRRQKVEDVYPRYEAVRDQFENEVKDFCAFLASEDLGEIAPNQCEVTYVNIIEESEVNIHRSLSDVSPLWSGAATETPPGEFEDVQITARYVLHDSGDKIGRIYAIFQPAIRQNNLAPVLKFEITARAKPKEATVSDAFRVLDLERAAVVQTFAALTTRRWQKIWGRKDAG